jgi:recombination protein RecT
MASQTNAVATQQPTAPPAKASPLATVQGLLEKYKGQIAMALPKHMTPERMIRVALTACSTNPKLLECDPYTVCGSIVQASIMGLEPNSNLGECFLVPYWNSKKGQRGGYDCQLQIGYKGHVKLARNSGEIAMVDAQPVYSNDEFECEKGETPFLRHKRPISGPRGELVGYWAGFKTKDGTFNFEYMTVEEIEEHRDRFTKSKNKQGEIYGPWVDNPDWMFRKTVLIQALKLAPKSVDRNFAAAITLDDQANAGIPQQFSVEVPLELQPAPDPEIEQERRAEIQQPQRKSEKKDQPPATDQEPADVWPEVVKAWGSESEALKALNSSGYEAWEMVNVKDRARIAMGLIAEAKL